MHDARRVWFWIAAAVITLINCTLWFAFNQGPTHAAASDTVQFELATTARDLQETGRIVLVSNQEVFATEAVGKAIDPPPFSITPHVPADWRVVDTQQIALEPHNPPKAGHTYTISPEHDHPAWRGWTLEHDHNPQFTYLPLHLRSIHLDHSESVDKPEQDPMRRSTIELLFNTPVARTDCQAHTNVRVGHKIAEPIWTSDPIAATHQFEVLTAPAAVVTVEIASGLTGHGGAIAIGRDRTARIRIPVDLEATQVDTTEFRYSRSNPDLIIRFNHKLDPTQQAPSIRVTPDIGPISARVQNASVTISGNFEQDADYVIEIDPPLLAVDGTTLVRTTSKSVHIPIGRPILDFPQSSGRLGTTGAFELDLLTRGVKEARIQIDRLLPQHVPIYLSGVMSNHQVPQLSTRIVDAALQLAPPGLAKKRSTALQLGTMMPQKPGVYRVKINDTGTRWLGDSMLLLVSDLSMNLQTHSGGMLIWMTDTRSGKGAPNVDVTVWSRNRTEIEHGTTDESGLLQLTSTSRDADIVIARLGDDFSFLHTRAAKQIDDRALSGSPWSGPLDVALYADRGVHRPGETIHLTGVVRTKAGAVPGSLPLEVRFTRPDERVMQTASVQTDREQSIFHIDLDTENDGPTGNWRATVHLAGDDSVIATLTCPVMPVLPVRLAVKSTRLESLDGNERVKLRSTYLHGAPAAGLPATATTTFTPVRYASDQYKAYRFEDPRSTMTIKRLQNATLSQDGTILITIPQPSRSGTWNGIVETSVSELGGRATTARTHIDTDTAMTHLGLRAPDGQLYGTNAPITLEAIRLEPEAAATSPTVNATLNRIENKWELVAARGGQRQWRSIEISTPVQNVTSTFKPTTSNQWSCTVPPLPAGTYRLTASTRSATRSGGMETLSVSIPLHVSDHAAKGRVSADRPDRIELVLEHQNVQPGMDTSVLVRTPFPGEALLTIETDEIKYSKVVSVTGDGVRVPISIPIEARDTCFVGVTLIRPLDPTRTQWLPIQARGAARVKIDRSVHTLRTTIAATDRAKPGDSVHVSVSGPTRADDTTTPTPMVHVWAVEEGALLLTDYNAPRLTNAFLRDRRRVVASATTTSDLLPDYTRPVGIDRIGGDAARRFRSPVPIRQREIQVLWHDSRPLPQIGLLEYDFEMPELDGAMRIMAVVVDGDRFGQAQHRIAVTAPLAIIAALPRAVAPGDSMDIPVQLHNHTDAAVSLTCDVEHSTAIAATFAPTSMTIPAGGQHAATLHVDAATIGQATIQLNATPATGQTATLAGTIAVRPPFGRSKHVQHIEVMPGMNNIIERSRSLDAIDGRIDIVVGGTPAIDLGEIINGLIDYPWGCGEQTGSRTQGLIAALRMPPSVTGVSKASILAMAQSGIDRLWNMQRRNGSIGYWPGDRGNSWITLRTALIAFDAQASDLDIPGQFLNELVGWAADNARKFRSNSQSELAAMACRVLAQAGMPDHALLKSLAANSTAHSAATLAHLASAAAITGDLDTAHTLLEGVSLRLQRLSYGRFQSSSHDAAIVLDVILRHNLTTPLRLDLLYMLTESRSTTGWRTTFADAAVVDALSRWPIPVIDTVTTGQLTVGGRVIEVTDNAPARYSFTPDVTTTLVESIQSTGTGPLYAAITSSGVTSQSGPLPAIEHGILIAKKWLDPLGTTIAPGTPIQAGDLIMVDITVSAPYDQGWDDVALVDVLPGGMEFELPSLATSAGKNSVKLADVDRIEFLDDRMVAFLRVDKHPKRIRYVLRAVVPGQWAVPPTDAMAMYDAEAYGRSAAHHVQIVMP